MELMKNGLMVQILKKMMNGKTILLNIELINQKSKYNTSKNQNHNLPKNKTNQNKYVLLKW